MSANKSFSDIVGSETPTLIDFYAEWCGPCKMMGPILQDVAKSYGKDLKIVKIDVDKNANLAAKLKIRGVPTLSLYKSGNQVWRDSGVKSVTQLKSIIDQFAN
jgi:thioredoxin 1